MVTAWDRLKANNLLNQGYLPSDPKVVKAYPGNVVRAMKEQRDADLAKAKAGDTRAQRKLQMLKKQRALLLVREGHSPSSSNPEIRNDPELQAQMGDAKRNLEVRRAESKLQLEVKRNLVWIILAIVIIIVVVVAAVYLKLRSDKEKMEGRILDRTRDVVRPAPPPTNERLASI
jgi:hypothetical protein